jgi:mgtE-like transporter
LIKVLNSRILRQVFIALAFDLGGIVSGRLILTFSPIFQSAPWILAMFPPLLTVRGNIGGILSGKLGTMLHIGEAKPKIRGNTAEFYSFVQAVLFLSFVDTLGIGIFAFAINSIFGNASSGYFQFFIVVPVLTCLLAMSIAIPIASFFGFEIFKRGLDPDVILYPVMSTVDDVLITVCYVIVISLVLIPGTSIALWILTILLSTIFVGVLARNRKKRIFRKTLVEGAAIVLFASILGIFGGVGLARLRGEIEKRPSILLLYPALIDTLGDIGSILGAMETTKLALGTISSFKATLKATLADVVSIETAAATMHIAFGVAAFLLGRLTGLNPDLSTLIAIALVTNLISFFFVSLFSLAVATQTFKHGLDPDNFVIPLVASVSDVGATLALITAITIIGI